MSPGKQKRLMRRGHFFGPVDIWGTLGGKEREEELWGREAELDFREKSIRHEILRFKTQQIHREERRIERLRREEQQEKEPILSRKSRKEHCSASRGN